MQRFLLDELGHEVVSPPRKRKKRRQQAIDGKCRGTGHRETGHGLYTQIHTRKKAYRLDWGGSKMELAVRAVRVPRSEDGGYQIVSFFFYTNLSGTRPMFYRISNTRLAHGRVIQMT